MKSNRQSQILELIREHEIETQNQLMEALAARGIKSTQATLSRDIKELRLIKKASPNGGYCYALPVNDNTDERNIRLRKIFRECVVSFDTAQNLVVIHTLPGLANAAASALDNMDMPDLVGTIAGDDTAFLAMRDAQKAVEFCREIEAML
ncbi:MAG: arginine repressor [Oscillospiraceae bacterium]|nr:arginine repressor [Oscillospiraceae bacterium]